MFLHSAALDACPIEEYLDCNHLMEYGDSAYLSFHGTHRQQIWIEPSTYLNFSCSHLQKTLVSMIVDKILWEYEGLERNVMLCGICFYVLHVYQPRRIVESIGVFLQVEIWGSIWFFQGPCGHGSSAFILSSLHTSGNQDPRIRREDC